MCEFGGLPECSGDLRAVPMWTLVLSMPAKCDAVGLVLWLIGFIATVYDIRVK